MSSEFSPPSDSIPYKLSVENNRLSFHWLELRGKQFTEPFFEETIRKCKSNSPQGKNISSPEVLFNTAASVESLTPSAFIFHVSRCGSTLLSQLLATGKNNIVLSEVPLIDQLLRIPYQNSNFSQQLAEEALVASLRLMGQRRSGQEKNLIVKLDSWHLFSYETLRKLYPKAIFIFLYRSPGEVIRSQRKQKGMQFIPGLIEPAFLGFHSKEITQFNLDEYLQILLEKYFVKMNQLVETDSNFILLNYKQGYASMMKSLVELLDLRFSKEESDLLEARSTFHSKHPHQSFTAEALIEADNEESKKLYIHYNLLEEKILSLPL